MNPIGRIVSRSGFQLAALLLAVVYTLSFCFWGRGCEDPYYWLSVFEKADITRSLSSGTLVIGHLWGQLFGYRILSFRILGWVCCITALCLPYFSIVRRAEWLKANRILSLTISIVLMGYGTFNEFSPGTLTFLLLSIIALLLYRFWHSKKLIIPIALGISSAFAIWCRLPNVLVLPVIFGAIITKSIYSKTEAKYCVINELYFIGSTMVFLSIISIISSGTANYLSVISSAFVSGNSGGHSISTLASRMLESANDLLFYIAAAFIFQLFEKSKSTQSNSLFFILVALLYAFFIKENIGAHKWFNQELHLLQSAISICMLLLVNHKLLKSDLQSSVICLDFCFLVLMVLPIGSDTGLLKLFPALLVPVPFMAHLLQVNFKNPIGGTLLAGLILISILSLLVMR